MSHYSTEQKEAIVNKYLDSQLSIRDFSRQEGIAKSSLYAWCKKFNKHNDVTMNRANLNPEQRFSVVLETAALSEEKLSQYCREKGLYPDQVKQWKQACITANTKVTKVDDKADKKRIKELEKELRRKEKALAETAALLVLRKKVNAHFGLEEE